MYFNRLSMTFSRGLGYIYKFGVNVSQRLRE